MSLSGRQREKGGDLVSQIIADRAIAIHEAIKTVKFFLRSRQKIARLFKMARFGDGCCS